MTSYAMANAEKLNKEILMRHSTQGEAGRSWTVTGQHHHSMEATAYAVLALVKAKDFDKAGEAVRWLRSQQSHYGGSGTTQATIMVFQAVAEYHIEMKNLQSLDVELAVEGRSRPTRWIFKRQNVHIAWTNQIWLNKYFNVTATGTGTATLTVFTVYYAKPVEKSDCKLFDLSVKMEHEHGVHFLGAIESYKLTVEILYKNQTTDARTVLDVGLLTGFQKHEGGPTEVL
ncbi:hypothetical protein PO909_015930 [Leuciscus waleckii]